VALRGRRKQNPEPEAVTSTVAVEEPINAMERESDDSRFQTSYYRHS